jgi:tetratricopeptide (TPR) repeat protein
LLKAQGRPAQAAEEFQRAVEINPDYVKALVKLGLTRHEMGQLDKAQKHLERAVLLEPGYADVHYQLGLIYADQNRYQMAVEQFEESQQRNRGDVQVRAALAQALENIGLADRARASWKAVIELAPDSEQAKLAQAALGN